jgi:hypothetical protein
VGPCTGLGAGEGDGGAESFLTDVLLGRLRCCNGLRHLVLLAGELILIRSELLYAAPDTAAQSARFAPVGRGQQSLQRSVVQSGGIALAFHRQAQHRARQLVRFHSFVADRLERQPRFVESCL